MADRFRIAAFADLGIEPAARILSARLAGQRQAPFAESLFEERIVQRRQIAHFADPAGVQIPLRHFADAGNLADVERRQETRLLAGKDPQDAIWLRLIGGDLRDQARRRSADGAIEIGRLLHGVVQPCAA